MYEKFRSEVLTHLNDLDTETLKRIAKAMDMAAQNYAVNEVETGITVSPHIMRHTMATQALTGTGVEVVQKMLGHASIATTMIYAEVDASSVHAAHLRCVL